MPNHTSFLKWVYEDATKLPHSYLFLDMKPDTGERIRIRTNILPGEEPQYAYLK